MLHDKCAAVAARATTYGALKEPLSAPGAKNKDRNLAFVGGVQRMFDRGEDDNAAADFGDPKKVEEYLKKVGSSANRRSALSHIQGVIISSTPEEQFREAVARVAADARTELGKERRSIVPLDILASAVGIGTTTLQYMLGKLKAPMEENRLVLERIESLGKAPPGTLTRFVSVNGGEHAWISRQYFNLRNPGYNWKPTVTERKTIGDGAVRELIGYFEYKSADIPKDSDGRELMRNGVWSPSAKLTHIDARLSDWETYPSAFITFSQITPLLSEATRRHGAAADTLVIVTDVELITSVLKADIALRGVYHNGHAVMVQHYLALLHPDHGYLVQMPGLFQAKAMELGLSVSGGEPRGLAPFREGMLQQCQKTSEAAHAAESEEAPPLPRQKG